MEKEAEQLSVRISSRATKGQLPQRFREGLIDSRMVGTGMTGPPQDAAGSTILVEMEDSLQPPLAIQSRAMPTVRSMDSKSQKTAESKISSVELNQAAALLKKNTEINGIRNEVTNLKRDVALLEIEECRVKQKLEEAQQELQYCIEEDDAHYHRNYVRDVRKEYYEVNRSLQIKKVDLMFAEDQLDGKIVLIKSRFDVEFEKSKLRKQLEQDIEDIRDDEIGMIEETEKKKDLEVWTKAAEELLETVKAREARMQTASFTPTAEVKDPVILQENPVSPGDSMMEKYFEMKMKLLEVSNRTPKQDVTSQFMARQSHSWDLPFFSGRPEEWPQFYCDFSRTTEICKFTDAENVSRLRKCLKGEAAKAVQCLMISPDNLAEVMQTLKTRFGQTDHIIEAMINAARKVPPVKEERFETLLEFGTAVINMTSTIKALKSEGHLSNTLLLKELESRLPNSYRLQWREWVEDKDERKQDLDFFTTWLKKKTDIVSALCPPKMSNDDREPQDRRRFEKHHFKRNEAVHTMQEKPPEDFRKKTESKCHGCDNSGHWIRDCRKFLSLSLDDRWKRTKEARLCMCCLIPGHRVADCRRQKSCGESGCEKKHHPLLHKQDAPKDKQKSQDKEEIYIMRENYSRGTIMQVIPIKVKGPKGEESVYAFLDNGSSITMMEEDLAKRLGLEGELSPFCIGTINSYSNQPNSTKVRLDVSGTYKGAKTYRMQEVRTVDVLPLKTATQNVDDLVSCWPYLKNVPLESFKNVKPTVLIGISDLYLITPQQHVGDSSDQPIALKSRLGWSIGGPQRAFGGRVNFEKLYHICETKQDISDEILHELVKKSLAIDDLGVKIVDLKPRSKEDKRAMVLLENTTKRVPETKRLETGLLWKTDAVELPESKQNAVNRLRCQERKMDRDENFAKQYVAKMDEYLEKGFIRKLNAEEVRAEGPRMWYLPHFGNINPNKPEKIRLVFDARAESNGTSLNSSLVQGPDLSNPLIAVLWKFRQYRVAFSGDVKDMFHRVFIREEDRSAQRFLWRGLDRAKEPDVYEMLVMIFGSTSSPCSAQYVKNLNAKEHEAEYPAACQAIINKMYVDDYLDSKPDEKSAISIIEDVYKVQAEGGFHVCNWISNSKDVMAAIPSELRAKDLVDLDLEKSEMPTGRILGLWWDPETDIITFRLNFHKVPKEIMNGSRRPSKREVLSLIMSVYDPLGFLAHLMIKARILNQEIWRCGLGWNDELTDELNRKWQWWLEELQGITEVRIQRCYSFQIPMAKDIQLHIFCDASEKAYAAVGFLRVKGQEGVDISIVSAKTRVAPLKPISIPRLELQAALLGSRLGKSIKDELEIKINSTYYWTDSITVLRWLRADARRFKQFISHRIGEIAETTTVNEWYWIPTKQNVADDATRDNMPSDLSSKSRPKEKDFQHKDVKDEEFELKPEFIAVTIEDSMEPEINRFSSWMKLIRTTAIVKRFVNNSKLHSIEEKQQRKIGPITLEDTHRAEKYWWKTVQRQNFHQEIDDLSGGKPVGRKSSLRKLDPFIDQDGILRVGGRIRKAPGMTENAKHPVVLNASHRYVKLFIADYHVIFGHQGKETVCNELRQKYWIVGLTSAVKKAWMECRKCQMEKVKPVVPLMGDLPEVRLTSRTRPFTNTGMDYFGPMFVTIGRRKEKRWGVLFTCMSTRATHLEIAESLSTDSAIMAIRRMSNRRGCPKRIHSDNGTNFHGANNELKKALKMLDQNVIHQKMTTVGIDWRFNPPATPHMGGSWERLVGSVKTVLHMVLKDRQPKPEILYTFFTEVENIINSRPLTHVSVDFKDPEALTPNHFLIGWSSGSQKDDQDERIDNRAQGNFEDDDLYLRKQWRTVQRLGDHFWIRWVREYLPTLTRRAKWFERVDPVKIGDIVIVADDQGPRSTWPKGRIVAVHPGKDGCVRVADVKLQKGIFRRPVAKLCVLDVRADVDEGDDISSSGGRMWKTKREKREVIDTEKSG